MITKFNKYKLITEDPDSFYWNDNKISWWERDARPFGVKTNDDKTKITEFLLGSPKSMHSDNNIVDKYGWEFPGRLWEEKKIISFWCYPSPNLLKQIINKLENELKTKILNNGWSIEVIERDGEIVKNNFSGDYYDDARKKK